MPKYPKSDSNEVLRHSLQREILPCNYYYALCEYVICTHMVHSITSVFIKDCATDWVVFVTRLTGDKAKSFKI